MVGGGRGGRGGVEKVGGGGRRGDGHGEGGSTICGHTTVAVLLGGKQRTTLHKQEDTSKLFTFTGKYSFEV